MAVAVDASTPATGSGAQSFTTASFTPPAGSLLVITVQTDDISNGSKVPVTITDNLGSHLTYTSGVFADDSVHAGHGGHVEVFAAPVVTSAAMTVTGTVGTTGGGFTGAGIAMQVTVVTGANNSSPFGASGTAIFSNWASSVSYSSTATGSMGFYAATDGFGSNPAITAVQTGDTLIDSTAYSVPGTSAFTGAGIRETTASTSTSQTITLGPNNAASADGNCCYVEILAATSTDASVTAVAATASATTPAPTVSGDANVAAVAALATAAAPAPTVTGTANVTAVVATATATAPTPSVSTATNVSVTAVAATATADALAPSVTGDATVTAVVATATASALPPSVSTDGNITLSPPAATASADAIAPAVSGSGSVSAVVATATADALAPSVATTSSVNVNAVVARATANAPVPIINGIVPAVPPPLTARLNIDRVIINLASDLSQFVSAGSAGAIGGGSFRADTTTQSGDFRQYANYNVRLIQGVATSRVLDPIVLRALTPDQVAKLKAWVGKTVLFRDSYGRKLYGSFLAPKFTDIPLSGTAGSTLLTDCQLAITETTEQ